MIRHTKYLLFSFLSIFSYCKQKNVTEHVTKSYTSVSKVINIEPKSNTFIFYKAFSFCDTDIGYFTEEQANKLYLNKVITLDNLENQQAKTPFSYSKEEITCLGKKLGITEIKKVTYLKTDDSFPFSELAFVNSKYLIVLRDGYFFSFISNTKETATSIKTAKISTSFLGFESLVNKKLTGLSLINKKAKVPYKKYGLDSSIVCMCDSPSLYINSSSNELIIFNYCASDLILKKIKDKTICKILKTEHQDNKLVITTKNFKISFKKQSEIPLFQVAIDGNFPKEFVGSDLKIIFTTKPEKFYKEDCGDFQG